MKVRHIKRRNHPVYDWRVFDDGADLFTLDIPEADPRRTIFIEGLVLDVRPVPALTLERVRRAWSRPQRAD